MELHLRETLVVDLLLLQNSLFLIGFEINRHFSDANKATLFFFLLTRSLLYTIKLTIFSLALNIFYNAQTAIA